MDSLRPFFSFYGGKWRSAKRYPRPRYNRIVEPFAGSAGYSLRYFRHDVILIEKDRRIADMWKWLISVDPAEILALPLLYIHTDIAKCQKVDTLEVREEAKTLIGFLVNSAASQPCNTPSKWMRTLSSDRANFWGEAWRRRVATQVPFIRHWTVIHGDYANAPDIEATWFIDPPYQVMGKHYRHSSKDIDFHAMGEWCRMRRGQVIVCENEGATWLPFRTFGSIKSARSGTYSKEMIWTNKESKDA